MCVFLLGNAHVSFADDLTYTEAYLTQKEGYSGIVQVPGKGPMRYYAQNDPLWQDLAYEQSETKSRRPFGDGGCGPTAGAMAIANLVPEAELSKIAQYAKKEYAICPCSITKEKCIHSYHARYVLTSQRDFVRFLPLVLGDFAIGNNTFGVSGRGADKGTNSGFLYQVAQAYGLNVTATTDKNAAFQALRQGCTVVGHAARGVYQYRPLSAHRPHGRGKSVCPRPAVPKRIQDQSKQDPGNHPARPGGDPAFRLRRYRHWLLHDFQQMILSKIKAPVFLMNRSFSIF